MPAFTPHLVPMTRGIFSTIYVKPVAGQTAESLHALLAARFADESVVRVLPFGAVPQTRHVKGTNFTFIGVSRDRRPGRAILTAVLDNLVKGASGQAVQNMNCMLGLPEETALRQLALFP